MSRIAARSLAPSSALFFASAALLAACATPPLPSIAQDPELDRFRSLGTLADYSLAVAQVGVPRNPQTEVDPEAPERWRLALDPQALAAGLAGAISSEVRLVARSEAIAKPAAQREAAMEDAWSRGHDLLLEVEVEQALVRYDGHNGWFFPNLLGWFYLWFPGLFAADEDYAFEADAKVRLLSTGTDQVLAERSAKLGGKRSLSDLDRGVKFYSTKSVPQNFGAENWRLVSDRLRPDLERGLLVEVLESLRQGIEGLDKDPRMSATLALCVGVGRHAKLDRPPFDAARDARALAAQLGGDPWIPDRNLRTLLDGQATRQGVLDAVERHLGRARKQDRVLLYFSGVGASAAEKGLLIPYDADPADLAGSAIALDGLAARLAALEAKEIFVVLDAAFGPQACPRGLASESRAAADPFAPFAADPRIVVLCAAERGGEAWNDPPDGSRGGLYTQKLLAGLQRDALGDAAADIRGEGNGDKRVSTRELQAHLARELLGKAMLVDPSASREQAPAMLAIGGAEESVFPGGEAR